MKDTARSRFRVVGQLGRGALADVYLCRLQGVAGFEKEMVVKRIVAEHAADPLFVRMFLDEARVVAKLTHANIVQVFEAGVEDGAPYIAMEYIRGVNLAMIIGRAHKDGKIHYGHFANIICGICEGLEYAHTALDKDGEPLGIVHRDVKPANIVVSLEGVPKLLEFGMASAKGRLSSAETRSFRGKLRYMAPEQISQGQIDHRADVYGLGVTLYELATGRNPFGVEGDPDVEVLDRALSGTFLKPSQVVPDFPPELESIILAALERDVAQRCGSARELRERLQAFMTAFPEHASNQRALAGWLRRLFPDFATLSKAGAVAGLAGPPASDPTPTTPVGPAGRRSSQTHNSLPPVRNGLGGGVGGGPGGGMGLPGGPGLGVDDDPGGLNVDPLAPRPFLMTQPMSQVPGPPPAMLPVMKDRSQGMKWAAVAVAGVAAGAAVWVLKLREPPPGPPVAPPIAAPSPTPDPSAAAKAYLDAAETFVGEKRYDPALDMVAKAADLKVEDPVINVRIAHLRDKISGEVALGKAAERPQWRPPPDQPSKGPVVEPFAEEPGGAAGRTDASARTAAVKRKARGREGTASVATDRRTAGRTKDEPVRYPMPGGGAQAHRRQAAAEPPVPIHQETAEPRESPPLPPPPSSRPAAAATPPAVPLPSPFSGGAHGSAKAAPPPSPTGLQAAGGARPASPPAAATRQATTTPTPSVPAPSLPRVYVTEDSERLARICAQVEASAISLAGVPADFARGITVPLRRVVRPNTPIYPMNMYYFVVREAAQKRDRSTAAANLAAAHASGAIRQSGP